MGAPVASAMATARWVATTSATTGRLSGKYSSEVRPAAVSSATARARMGPSSQCTMVRMPARPAASMVAR